jgi:alcohol dehydrogenase class IV
MSEIVTFAPSPSIFGFGALIKLPELLRSRNFKRLLIITDPQVGSSGILQRLVDLLKESFDWELFDGAPSEPNSIDIDKEKGRFGSGFDALLGLGGGSAMDFAKALSIIMTHGGLLADYVGEGTVPGPVLPIVCVPTTSGTGSQNTQTTVFSIGGVKQGCSSEYIRPVASIVDPELTMGLPSQVTRNSGFDALMHSIESFMARPHAQVPERTILYQGSNPFSQSLALEAFRLIWSSFPKAVTDGNHREARIKMSLGSHLAGIAFSHSGLGLVHALASSLGGMIDAPHGVCLAACANIGLNYNVKVCGKEMAILATIAGEREGAEPNRKKAEEFIGKIEALIRDFNFPLKPSDLGIKKEDAQVILDHTLIQRRRIQTNPRLLDDELLSYIEGGI